MTLAPLLLAQTLSGAAPEGLGAQLAMTVAAAVVAIGAIGTAVWLGRRVRADSTRAIDDAPPDTGPSELTSRHVFRVLQERKIASVEEIAAMSPRERQLLFEAVARRVTPIVGMPAVPAAAAAPAAPALAPPAGAHAPVGPLHCPACAAPIAAGADSNRIVAQCPGCGRRLSARRDGARVSVTVDDSPAAPRGVSLLAP